MPVAEALDHLESALQRLREADIRTRKRRSLARVERRLEDAMAKAWRTQGAAFLRRLETRRSRFTTAAALREAIRPQDWEPLFDDAALETLAAFSEPLSVAAAAALEAGARHLIADLTAELTFSLADPEAVAYLERVGAERVTGITEETRSQLRTLLAQSRAQGWSYDRTAREIRARFAGFGTPAPQLHIRSRAHLVAVTETGHAYEASRRIMADRLAGAGLAIEKSWLAVGDARTDEVCEGNEAEGWIELEGSFSSGSPEPPEHPACRCTTEYRRRPD